MPRPKVKYLKVAIVHDDLVQWGGAERVLLAISELFPEAPIYTSLYDLDHTILKQKFAGKTIMTSFLQKMPFWKKFYRGLVPIYPLAFEQFDLSGFDLVISHTTRFAKSIITKPNTLHICYCHTPPRFLWHFSGDLKIPALVQPLLSWLRLYDQISSHRVDRWLAGSYNCQRRLRKIYQVDSVVLQPFVDDIFLNTKLVKTNQDYYLVVARLLPYKNVELVIRTFNQLGTKLIIIGTGPQQNFLKQLANPNVSFIEQASDEVVRQKIQQSKAIVIAAEEDFGMVSLEGQALGKPIIAYGKGGSLESVVDGKTGVLFDQLTEESLTTAITKFEKMTFKPINCRQNAARFSHSKFITQFEELISQITSKYTN